MSLKRWYVSVKTHSSIYRVFYNDFTKLIANLNQSKISIQSDKVQKLTNDISETRTGVTDVKCFIDGMRTSRDTKMKDLADLKAKLKDQNQRLIQVTQDKARVRLQMIRLKYFICLKCNWQWNDQ